MRVPLSWLIELVDLPTNITTEQLSEALTRCGLQVERVEVIGGEVSGPVVVGKVLEFVEEPQKNGKIIRWCQVEVGEDAPRGIVCGANNFAPGDYVVVALPGAVLPGDFAIASRKTYGHISDGMICAEDELGLGTDHAGIIVLDPQLAADKLGADALDVMAARDEVLEIDVTPDLGHCMSMRGIAREVAQAFDLTFNDPYDNGVIEPATGGYPIELASANCTMFTALRVSDADPNAATPVWMARRLAAAGMRSISLNVDITNYVMLESGQPLHAYDADKLAGPIVVRQAKAGETLVTLDDAKRDLDPDDLLITDDSGPIGLAGVMGGQTTEISETTTNILLEGAAFNPGSIGRTFRRHKLPSEASARFARGVDPALGVAAVKMAARLMAELGGAKIAEEITITGSVPQMPKTLMRADLPAKILGAPISEEQVVEILRTAGVKVSGADEDLEGEWLSLVPPTWRGDLVDPFDYVEEVGCKVGFGLIQAQVPKARAGKGYTFEQLAKRRVMHAAVAAGFVELITLPFIGSEDLTKLGLAEDDSRRATVKLANPLADTQPFMRTTLLPGLFAAMARNTSRSQNDLAIFESGSVFLANDHGAAPILDVSKRPSDAEIDAVTNHLPDQPTMLSGVLCGDWVPAGWQGPAQPVSWAHAVYLAETAASALGLKLKREACRQAPWHPGRCARLVAEVAGEEKLIGYAGELHPLVIKAYGLPADSCAVELNLDALIAAAPRGGQVSPISPFPMTKEDVALIVDAEVPATAVREALVEGAGELLETIRLFDIYTGAQLGEGKKSLAFALGFRAPDRTLKETEVAQSRQAAVALAAERCGAVQRA